MCSIFLACLSLPLPPSTLLVSFFSLFVFCTVLRPRFSLSLLRMFTLSSNDRNLYTCMYASYIYVRLASVIHIVLRQNYRQVLPLTPVLSEPFRFAYLHLLFYNRYHRDETVINSLLPCRFFAAIHNYCNARSTTHGPL